MTTKTLTIEEARALLIERQSGAHNELELVTHEAAKAYTVQIVAACELLEEHGTAEDKALAEEVVGDSCFDYDARGNFVGHVAHENGWTA